MTNRDITEFQIDWRGIVLRITYEANWLDSDTYSTAHLEVRSIAPACEPLPITETGYRSHFAPAELIEEEGGPVPFVRAWLDAEAAKPFWERASAERRQLNLFA